jgi:hypothetical protein
MMSEDLGPGTVVEIYRGKNLLPVMKGMRFTVLRAWEDDEPCIDCIPGYSAPAIELLNFPVSQPPGAGPLCSCCFRPVRNGGAAASTLQRTRECEPA